MNLNLKPNLKQNNTFYDLKLLMSSVSQISVSDKVLNVYIGSKKDI